MSAEPLKYNLLTALFGLVIQPGRTAENLLDREHPPYVFTFFIFAFSALFVPMLCQIYYYGDAVYKPDAVLTLMSIFSFALMVFILLEALFLRTLGFNVKIELLSACVVYALIPLALAVLITYTFNYLATGSLSLVTFLVAGYRGESDSFLHYLGYAIGIGQLILMSVFCLGVRFVGDMGIWTAMIVTLFSVIPYACSLFIGSLIGEFARPGTAQIFIDILTAPQKLTPFL